jgi:branched-chain amino acid aminotransferase
VAEPLGALVDGEPATSVPVTDRGFLYGDSLFEVLRSYDGSPAFFDEHFERMSQGGVQLDYPEPCPVAAFAADLRALLAEADGDRTFRLYWTRGDGGGIAGEPERTRRVSMAFTVSRPPASAYREGVECLLARGRATEATGAKVANYVSNILATRRARAAGAHEALMVDGEGRIGEGATSNVFALIGGRLVTPPVRGILPGVTRSIVLREARAEGIEVEERALRAEALTDASEVFLTSSIREVLPVRAIDGRPVGQPGPITRRLAERYEAAARADAERWAH